MRHRHVATVQQSHSSVPLGLAWQAGQIPEDATCHELPVQGYQEPDGPFVTGISAINEDYSVCTKCSFQLGGKAAPSGQRQWAVTSSCSTTAATFQPSHRDSGPRAA